MSFDETLACLKEAEKLVRGQWPDGRFIAWEGGRQHWFSEAVNVHIITDHDGTTVEELRDEKAAG